MGGEGVSIYTNNRRSEVVAHWRGRRRLHHEHQTADWRPMRGEDAGATTTKKRPRGEGPRRRPGGGSATAAGPEATAAGAKAATTDTKTIDTTTAATEGVRGGPSPLEPPPPVPAFDIYTTWGARPRRRAGKRQWRTWRRRKQRRWPGPQLFVITGEAATSRSRSSPILMGPWSAQCNDFTKELIAAGRARQHHQKCERYFLKKAIVQT